jgi:hypothetical protein
MEVLDGSVAEGQGDDCLRFACELFLGHVNGSIIWVTRSVGTVVIAGPNSFAAEMTISTRPVEASKNTSYIYRLPLELGFKIRDRSSDLRFVRPYIRYNSIALAKAGSPARPGRALPVMTHTPSPMNAKMLPL